MRSSKRTPRSTPASPPPPNSSRRRRSTISSSITRCRRSAGSAPRPRSRPRAASENSGVRRDSFSTARLIALLLPLALMAGALASQYIGGLYPCEMCHWQRWPHYAAIILAALAFVVPGATVRRLLLLLAAVAIGATGAIGVFHAGVEYHSWQCCTAVASTTHCSCGTP